MSSIHSGVAMSMSYGGGGDVQGLVQCKIAWYQFYLSIIDIRHQLSLHYKNKRIYDGNYILFESASIHVALARPFQLKSLKLCSVMKCSLIQQL